MRVLVYEHFCSGGLAGLPVDAELLAAGGGMLRGLAEDFQAAGEDVCVLLDKRVPLSLPGQVIAFDATTPERSHDAFDEALSTVDAAVVIAPEFADLLPLAVERVERSGVKHLGSASAAIRDASDKHALCLRMHAAGIPMPAGALGLDHAPRMLDRYSEIILKPNRGAGCFDTFVCRSADDVARVPRRTDWLIQQRIHGTAASVTFILPAAGPPIPLRAGTQTIGTARDTHGEQLFYLGGELPLAPELEARAIRLGLAALPHLPGLHGSVGLDLVLGENAADDMLIEVNARPTVAYAGLRRLAQFNIANLILGRPTHIAWRSGPLRYAADGSG